jgi:hypothetical protein
MLYRSADCPYAECHILFIVILNAIMLSVIMLSVVAPFRRYGFSHHLVSTYGLFTREPDFALG